MISKLWHDQIVGGKKTYAQVPSRLKQAVAALLRESGHEDLITE